MNPNGTFVPLIFGVAASHAAPDYSIMGLASSEGGPTGYLGWRVWLPVKKGVAGSTCTGPFATSSSDM